jgi:hypothetical protein
MTRLKPLTRRNRASLNRLIQKLRAVCVPDEETQAVLNDPDLMDSIQRSRRDRKRGDRGTSLEDARTEIVGEDA